jgi:hypothetical protein
MAFTKTDLDAIDRAIASGARVVQFADHRTEFRSIEELYAARDKIAAEIAINENQRMPPRIRRIAHGGKGI